MQVRELSHLLHNDSDSNTAELWDFLPIICPLVRNYLHGNWYCLIDFDKTPKWMWEIHQPITLCRKKWGTEDQAAGMRDRASWHLTQGSPLYGHYWLLNGVSSPQGEERRAKSITLISWQGLCLSRFSLRHILQAVSPDYPTYLNNIICLGICNHQDETSKSDDHTTVADWRIFSSVRQKVDE